MKLYSPLRYPGGKRKLANFIARVCERNVVRGHYIEPYAGGAAVALYLLLQEVVDEITINDKDRSIYAFWYSVKHYPLQLCELINKTPISLSEWKKQREIQKKKKDASLLELGFSTFFLNRTNRSGIIEGGPIGGIKQTGDYKINCRYNKKELISRIKKIAEKKGKIHVYNLDAIELVKKLELSQKVKNGIFYFDPPYFLKGESLYLNSYNFDDHVEVSRVIKSIKNSHWILTYDNTLPIRELYKSYRSKRYTLPHFAYKPRIGKEIMYLSNHLLIPKTIFVQYIC
ncbi:MAG: DNA adenine methylase [Ignavibacteriales bacterium]|nr:DNA adenine methylase [Ignavibacteriales bacterium]